MKTTLAPNTNELQKISELSAEGRSGKRLRS